MAAPLICAPDMMPLPAPTGLRYRDWPQAGNMTFSHGAKGNGA
jgi:hypothetical protein